MATAKASTFGFSNPGQIGNDLTALGAGINLVSSFGAASALDSAGATTAAAGAQNRAIYYARAAVQDQNAKYTKWKGQYESTRIRQEAEINAGLAEATYAEKIRAADVTLQSANRTLQLARAKKSEYNTEAESIWKTATTNSLRQYQEGRRFLGQQAVATAKAGFVMEGSELDALVENATRIETGRLDQLRTAAEEARQTRFAGSMALYEGETVAFDQGEQYRAITYTANVDKYKADVAEWNAEQEAQVVLAEAKQTAWNLKQNAKDLRSQGDLALQEALARQAAMEAQAKEKRSSGIIGALTSVAGLLI